MFNPDAKQVRLPLPRQISTKNLDNVNDLTNAHFQTSKRLLSNKRPLYTVKMLLDAPL